MPRPQNEKESIQYVQDLAEIDGPFQSPININFRDTVKLELPPLVWNRSEVIPKKMKVTNTGHTVIVSGKWKTDRPYITGGPLKGNYVFSQIHFHWGPNDCKGSEHTVNGEAFPLEMHVTHFKTEYLNQETALREKDGMVVLVYLFKIQDEPNVSLKKVLSALQCVRQPSTSHHIDPRSILALCHPFADDYFMYWGSVITSTCAHILLWLVSREPFGISADQMEEFRKVLDSCNRPIRRNSRDQQPLHKRNVFHVNPSTNLDDPLLPVRKIVGCFCRPSEEASTDFFIPQVKKTGENCRCGDTFRTQEEIEGQRRASSSKPPHHNTLFVQHATVHSTPELPKMFTPPYEKRLGDNHRKERTIESRHSCCFPTSRESLRKKNEAPRRDKQRSKKKNTPDSVKALSDIIESLEELKNRAYNKIRDIESIREEIRALQVRSCSEEDQRWFRKAQKIMSREKRFTIRTSQCCFAELSKLAKNCNVDNIVTEKMTGSDVFWFGKNKELRSEKKQPAAVITIYKETFVKKAMKLVKNFLSDIKEHEDKEQAIRKCLELKKFKNKNGYLKESQSVRDLFSKLRLGSAEEDVKIKNEIPLRRAEGDAKIYEKKSKHFKEEKASLSNGSKSSKELRRSRIPRPTFYDNAKSSRLRLMRNADSESAGSPVRKRIKLEAKKKMAHRHPTQMPIVTYPGCFTDKEDAGKTNTRATEISPPRNLKPPVNSNERRRVMLSGNDEEKQSVSRNSDQNRQERGDCMGDNDKAQIFQRTKLRRRCDVERYHFLEKEMRHVSSIDSTDNPEDDYVMDYNSSLYDDTEVELSSQTNCLKDMKKKGEIRKKPAFRDDGKKIRSPKRNQNYIKSNRKSFSTKRKLETDTKGAENPKSCDAPKPIREETFVQGELYRTPRAIAQGLYPTVPLAVQKAPKKTDKRTIPTYTVTSCMPSLKEVVEKHQRQANEYFIYTDVEGYFFDDDKEVTIHGDNENKNDSLDSGDLEYLIRLEMCINDDISTNVENSMNYVKTLLSQDYEGRAIIEKPPMKDTLNIFESPDDNIVFIEMKDSTHDNHSPSQQNTFRYYRNPCKSEAKREPSPSCALQGYNTESSYDCEVSISLRSDKKKPEDDNSRRASNLLQKYTYHLGRGEESNISIARERQEHLNSPASDMKPQVRKRKDKMRELPKEIKQKLLEMLEEEMKAISKKEQEPSSALSSLRQDDSSEILDESLSTEIESNQGEHSETYTHISEIVKQFLTDYKDKKEKTKRLP